MSIHRLLTRAIVAIAVVTLAGCATFRHTEPFPKEQKQAEIQISKDMPSAWSELPTGVYAIPNTRLLVSGHQAGNLAAIAFGPLGVLVGSAINAERGKSLFGDDKSMEGHDLATRTETLVREALPADAGFRLSADTKATNGAGNGAANGPQLSLMPFGVLSFVNDTEVRPYVVIRSTLKDAAGKELWTTRYISAAASVKPLIGDNGWLADKGKALMAALDESLRRDIEVMLRDIAGHNLRESAKLMSVGGQYAFVKQPLKIKGTVVLDEPDYIAFTPKLGDVMVFSGVNIFERSSVAIAAATEQDPVFEKFDPASVKVAKDKPETTAGPVAPVAAATATVPAAAAVAVPVQQAR